VLFSVFQGLSVDYPGVLTLIPRAVVKIIGSTAIGRQFFLIEPPENLSSNISSQIEVVYDRSKSDSLNFGTEESISELINRMVCDVLGKEFELDLETNLLELGLESFAMTELSHSFSVTFGVSLSPLFFYDQPLFGDLEKAVLAMMRK
jgi:acyl carrier protein